MPLLQRPENLWWFLHEHRKHPVISPALLKKITDGFVTDIHDFAANADDPLRRAWLSSCGREIDRALAQARLAA